MREAAGDAARGAEWDMGDGAAGLRLLGSLLAPLLGRRDGERDRAIDVRAVRSDALVAAVEVAAWHGLRPALHQALREALGGPGAPDALPDAVRRQLEEAHTLAALRAEARRRQLHELLAALDAAGVRVIVLKGAYLAEHTYPAPALRPMSDLDLLVREPGPGTALAALSALGYAPADPAADAPAAAASARRVARHAPRLLRPGRLPVELHHTIEPCAPPFTLPLDGVWARATPCVSAGAATRALAPEDLLLHVATHMGRSHVLGASLVSVCDVLAWTARFGATADWDALVHRARSAGVRRFVYAALALAHRTLGATFPAGVEAALRGPGDEEVVAHALRVLAATPFMVLGAKAVTDPHDSPAASLARVARALLVTPARHPLGASIPDRIGAPGVDARPADDGYRARWAAVARLLLRPAAARAAARHVASVRALRRWAAAAPGAARAPDPDAA